jgi:hypothetical protein
VTGRPRPSVAVAAVVVCVLSLVGLFSQAFVGHHGVDWEGIGWGFAWCGFPIAGAVIVARRPQNHVGLAMMGTGIFVGLGDAADALVPRDYTTVASHSLLDKIALNVDNWAYAPAYLLIIMVPLLFPLGRFSRRWRVVAWALAVDLVVLVLTMATRARVHMPRGARSVPNPFHQPIGDALQGLVPVLTMVLALSGVAAIAWSAFRYWRSSGIERLQRQWVAYTVITAGGVFACALAADPGKRLGSALSLVAMMIGISGTGAAIAAAVLRYHLYDIDRLVSRTVSYAVVTGLLLGFYLGVVTLASRAMSLRSSWGVAAATLATAAMFNPLRRRVQRTVDRRFNRARFDASRVVDAFAAHVRDAVALDSVRDELARTVQKTVQPAHVSVWLV